MTRPKASTVTFCLSALVVVLGLMIVMELDFGYFERQGINITNLGFALLFGGIASVSIGHLIQRNWIIALLFFGLGLIPAGSSFSTFNQKLGESGDLLIVYEKDRVYLRKLDEPVLGRDFFWKKVKILKTKFEYNEELKFVWEDGTNATLDVSCIAEYVTTNQSEISKELIVDETIRIQIYIRDHYHLNSSIEKQAIVARVEKYLHTAFEKSGNYKITKLEVKFK